MASSYLSLEQLVGNEDAVERAQSMLQSGKIPQSLLLTGPCAMATEEFARAFAEKLLTQDNSTQGVNHPDLYLFRPEGKSGQHTIESLRLLASLLPLPPTQGARKVCIVLDADRMALTSANAFLKTLEEPAKDSILMLTSKAPKRILPTLLSRCQTILLQALSCEQINDWLVREEKVEPKLARTFAKLAEGSQGRARMLAYNAGNYREQLLQFLETSAKQGSATYVQLHELSGILASAIESQITQTAKTRPSDGIESDTKEFWSPAQRQAEEKQQEGQSALLLKEAFQLLCIQILAYFRDMHAIGMGLDKLDKEQLYDVDLVGRSVSLNSNFSKLELWEAKMKHAQALLDRFTPLRTCIEALFL